MINFTQAPSPIIRIRHDPGWAKMVARKRNEANPGRETHRTCPFNTEDVSIRYRVMCAKQTRPELQTKINTIIYNEIPSNTKEGVTPRASPDVCATAQACKMPKKMHVTGKQCQSMSFFSGHQRTASSCPLQSPVKDIGSPDTACTTL